MRRRSESFDNSSNAVMRFGALRENPSTIIEPLSLPSVESYSEQNMLLNAVQGIEVNSFEMRLREEFEKGVLEGQRRSKEEAQLEMSSKVLQIDSTLSALGKAVDALNRALADLRIAEEHDLATFAIAIAAEIIGSTIYEKHEFLMSSITKAIEISADAKRVNLRLNPQDFELVSELIDSGKINASSQLSLISDRAVELSSVIVEADAMRLDLQLGTALDRVRQSLESYREGL